MKEVSDADFCFIDPDIERRASCLAEEITTVSQLVDLQAQRETFELGKRACRIEKDIASQAFHLAALKMRVV